MADSIREIIKEKSIELRNIEQLGATKASEDLVMLSSLLASLNAHIGEKNYWYNIKKQEMLKEHGVAAKAKIHAEASQEWRDYNDSVLQGKALEELIRSVKYYLRTSEQEQKLQNY